VTAAVQIQDYHGDLDPHNHQVLDSYGNINQDYLFEQIKATTAIAGHLTDPIVFEHRIRLPLIWVFKF
jgi:hypothetical protein